MSMLMNDFRIRFNKVRVRGRYWWVSLHIRMKKAFVEWLVSVLGKLDEQRLKKCTVGKEVSIELEKFVPDDGEWHHISMTVDYWLKLYKTGEGDEASKTHLYIDGEEKITFTPTDMKQSMVLDGGKP